MAAFRFRLAQVLRLRQALEDMEKRELQERLTTLTNAEISLRQAQAERERFAGHVEQAEAAGLAVAQFAALRQWYPILLDQQELNEQNTATARTAVWKQQEQVKQARREKLILERLEERQLDEFNLAQAKEEQVLHDEIAVQTWSPEESL